VLWEEMDRLSRPGVESWSGSWVSGHAAVQFAYVLIEEVVPMWASAPSDTRPWSVLCA